MARAISYIAGTMAAAVAMGFGFEPQQAFVPAAGDLAPAIAVAIVDRSHKGDRMPFASSPRAAPTIATVEVDGLADPTIVYREGAGRELYRADPAMRTTLVAKGTILPAITVRD